MALSQRAHYCSASEVLKQSRFSMVKMGYFEFDVELLISLVGARPVLWNKTDGTCTDRIETKKVWRRVCAFLHEDFEVLGMLKKRFW